MSTTNYNSASVGVPYVRVNNINIAYGEDGIPVVTMCQAVAVKLADGTVAEIEQIHDISATMNLADTTAIPLVDPTSGAALGTTTTLGQVMLQVLAAVRAQQLLQNP